MTYSKWAVSHFLYNQLIKQSMSMMSLWVIIDTQEKTPKNKKCRSGEEV